MNYFDNFIAIINNTVICMNLKRLEKSANQAIRNLRETKLKNGLTFMINADTLPRINAILNIRTAQ